MRKGLGFAAVGLGLGLVALLMASDSESDGSDSDNPIDTIQGLPTGGASSVKGYYDTIRAQIGWPQTPQGVLLAPTPLARAVWDSQAKEFSARSRAIMTYMSQHKGSDVERNYGPSPDKFSKQNFLVYRPGNNQVGVYGPQPWGWYLTDEYGRPYEGWGYGGSPFGAVLPLAQAILPLVPGIGTAASAGLAAAIALGQGKSLKDAGLAAARASLPPYAQIAFDIGVGVASGQRIDETAVNALENQYPGSKDAYTKGKALAKNVLA